MSVASISRPNTQASATQPVDASSTADARLRSLPKPARDKFEKLRRAELRARAMADGLYDLQQRAREQVHNAQGELGMFDRRHPPLWQHAVLGDPTSEQVAVEYPERFIILAAIEAGKVELARLNAEQAGADLGFATSNLLDWLATQSPSTKFVAAPTPLVKLTKGESFSDTLKATRDGQAALRDEIATTQNAPLTIAAAKLLAREQVALLADRGRPDITNLFSSSGQIEWPQEQFTAGGHGAHQFTVVTTVKDAFAFTVWAHRDAIISQLDAEIERAGDDPHALSADAQATRLAELRASLLQAARNEEAIIERLEAEGVQVRRTCNDPLVLLGLQAS
jgi:hypothetical protein